jgi:putative aldouronate transport system substrate-binding protein
MNLKNFMLAALIFPAAAGLIFAGGGNQKGTAVPAGNGKPVLLIGQQADPLVTDYKNNYLTQYMEKLHNINLDFYMLPNDAAEVRTKVSLMVSAGDLPDVINTGALTDETILDYGMKGAFISLNKYFGNPAKAPNFTAIRDSDKTLLLQSMTSADGNIYSLPRYEGTPWNEAPYRYYINKAWLDKLGLKIPTTTAELRNALIAFRDQDPNGNGRKDEIGLYGYYSGGYGEIR